MQVVEAGAVAEGDEELAAVGGGAGVGHGEHTDFPVAQTRHELVVEAVWDDVVARVLEAGVAALDDEARDDAIPGQAGVEGLAAARRERALGEADEAGDGGGRLLVIQLGDEHAAGRGELGVEAVGEFFLSGERGRETQRDDRDEGFEGAHGPNIAPRARRASPIHRPPAQRNEQIYSQMPPATSMVKPLWPGTSKNVPAG